MNEFLSYVTSFDPDFGSRIEGATEAEIERVEKAVQGPLPEDYGTFLRLMGHRDDEIIGLDVQTSVTDILSLYEEFASGEGSAPDDGIIFAFSGLSIEALYVERRSPHRVFQDAGDEPILWAASFRGLLYQLAFTRAAEKYGHTAWISSNDRAPRLPRAQQLLETLGMQRLWFADEVTLCYASDGDRVIVQQIAGEGAWLRLSCRSLLRLWSLRLRFSRALDVPFL